MVVQGLLTDDFIKIKIINWWLFKGIYFPF